MTSAAVGIIGPPGDPQCAAVEAALARRRVDVLRVPLPLSSAGAQFTWDGDSLDVDSLDTARVGAWYLRHQLHAFLPGDGFALHQRAVLLGAWLETAANAGARVVNPVLSALGRVAKPRQLDAARARGLRVPRTLVTTSADRARRFLEETRDAVTKPVAGGALVMPLDRTALDRMDQLSPAILQERVRGTAVRVTVVGGDVISSVDIPTEQLDYRADPAFQQGRMDYRPTALPPDVAHACVKLVADLGLAFSCMDFIRGVDGGYVFLEANTAPTFIDVERRTGHPISDALAALLHAPRTG